MSGLGGVEEFFEVVGFGAKAGDGADDAKIILAERGGDSDDEDEPDFSRGSLGGESLLGPAGGHDEGVHGIGAAVGDEDGAIGAGRDGGGVALEDRGAEGVPIGDADVAAQGKEQFLDGGAGVRGVEIEVDVLGEEDFGNGDHPKKWGRF